jgi:hypothetical protein
MKLADGKYASPWFAVAKANKPGEFREVVDLRAINQYVIPSAWPVTSSEQVIHQLTSAGFSRMGELDLKLAFWQVPVIEVDAERTAVDTEVGLCHFTRLTMGHADSSAQLERIIVQEIIVQLPSRLQNLCTLTVYRDNLYYSCKDLSSEQALLQFIADRATELNLKFGSGRVGVHEIPVLGFNVSAETITPIIRNLIKIRDFAVPRNKRDVKKFLGLVGFYRYLIPKYDDSIMRALTEKNKIFEWNEDSNKEFLRMKEKCREELVVAPYREGVPVKIYADASKDRIGAILVQEGKVVYHFSKALKGAQLRYSLTRKEALAVLSSLKKWEHLLSRDTEIYTDHQPLLGWASGSVSGDSLLEGWGLKLQEYHVTLKWIPGKENSLADAASRNLAQVSELRKIKDLLSGEVKAEELDAGLVKKSRRYKLENEILTYKGKKVPLEMELNRWLLTLHNDYAHPTASGLKRLIQMEYDYEDLEKDIQQITSSCDQCQRGEQIRPAKLRL